LYFLPVFNPISLLQPTRLSLILLFCASAPNFLPLL
jgi:hypothetical protein